MKTEELKNMKIKDLIAYRTQQYDNYRIKPFSTKGEKAFSEFSKANSLLKYFESSFSPMDEVRFKLDQLSYNDIFQNVRNFSFKCQK